MVWKLFLHLEPRKEAKLMGRTEMANRHQADLDSRHLVRLEAAVKVIYFQFICYFFEISTHLKLCPEPHTHNFSG